MSGFLGSCVIARERSFPFRDVCDVQPSVLFWTQLFGYSHTRLLRHSSGTRLAFDLDSKLWFANIGDFLTRSMRHV